MCLLGAVGRKGGKQQTACRLEENGEDLQEPNLSHSHAGVSFGATTTQACWSVDDGSRWVGSVGSRACMERAWQRQSLGRLQYLGSWNIHNKLNGMALDKVPK